MILMPSYAFIFYSVTFYGFTEKSRATLVGYYAALFAMLWFTALPAYVCSETNQPITMHRHKNYDSF